MSIFVRYLASRIAQEFLHSNCTVQEDLKLKFMTFAFYQHFKVFITMILGKAKTYL